jgi:hypothetical protein
VTIHRLHDAVPTRWGDALVAAGWLVALEVENFTAGHENGPLVVHALVVGVMGAAALWRRRAPLAFVLVVLACATVVISDWSSSSVVVAPKYVLIVIPYSVAREASLPCALIGLAAILAFGLAANLASKSAAGWYLGAPTMTGAFWAQVAGCRRGRCSTISWRATRSESKPNARAGSAWC